MSTAIYPLGMQSYNNRQIIGGYKTWKGDGIFSNPVSITAGNIRPLTNNDPTNVYPSKHGLPRPLKWQYRKGTTVPVPVIVVDEYDPTKYVYISNDRQVRSSTSTSLVGQTIDMPGAYSVKENNLLEVNESVKMDRDCKTCQGIGLTTNYYPETNITNNPIPVTESIQLCCNEQRKALRRVRPASTNLKKNYFTTLQQYRQNRCQTYDQKVFNFYSGSTNDQYNPYAKPGTPLSDSNLYVANCYPNTGLSGYTESEIVLFSFNTLTNQGYLNELDIENFNQLQINTISAFYTFLKSLSSGESAAAIAAFTNIIENPYFGMSLTGPSNPRGCKLVVYKPSNPQFAVQGSVESSTRTYKLGLTTVEKFVAQNNKYKRGTNMNTGGQPFVPFVYKTKTAGCNPALPIIFRQVSYNAKTCGQFKDKNLAKNIQNLGQLAYGPSVANHGISTNWSGVK
jgi:hypothetical protein